MIIARKIAYNVAFSSVFKILSTVLALILIGLITRYLGAGGFGDYATVLAFLSFFTALADLGLYSTVTREISRPNADESNILGNIFSLRICASLLIFLISPIIVIFFPYPQEVKYAIIIVALSFIFSSSYQILNGVFQKNLAMDKVATAEFIGKVIQVIFVYFAIESKLSFLWIIFAFLLNMVVSFLLVYFWSKKYIRFSFKIDFSFWKKFLRESYPLGIAAVISFLYFKLDTILLSVIKESSDVGIYNVAYKVIENITFFPAMIMGLILPIMSKNIFSDKQEFRKISNKTFKVLWIIVVPLLIGTLFLADGIIRLIGGVGFYESGDVLRILVFALVFIFFGNFFNSVLISGSKQKRLTLVLAVAAIFNIIFNLIFISKFSYLACASISVFTEMIVVVGTFYFVFKELNYLPKVEKFWNILGSGVIMAIFFAFFSGWNFFLLAFSGTAVYLISLWFFRAVETKEITSIISRN